MRAGTQIVVTDELAAAITLLSESCWGVVREHYVGDDHGWALWLEEVAELCVSLAKVLEQSADLSWPSFSLRRAADS